MALFNELREAWRIWKHRKAELSTVTLHPVRLAYTDAQGNNWYAFEDPTKLPGDRAISALVGMRRNDLNYTEEDEREWVKAAIAAHNAHEHAMVGHYLSVKLDRLDWACESRTLLDVAKVYYLLNDEPQHGAMLSKYQEAKEAAWAADPDAKAFFLREAYWLTDGFSDLSLSDIPTYLVERPKKIQTGSKPKPAGRRGARRAASATPEK